MLTKCIEIVDIAPLRIRLVNFADYSLNFWDESDCSQGTVEYHRANIMRKLGLNTHQELTRYCIETGISPPSEKIE